MVKQNFKKPETIKPEIKKPEVKEYEFDKIQAGKPFAVYRTLEKRLRKK